MPVCGGDFLNDEDALKGLQMYAGADAEGVASLGLKDVLNGFKTEETTRVSGEEAWDRLKLTFRKAASLADLGNGSDNMIGINHTALSNAIKANSPELRNTDTTVKNILVRKVVFDSADSSFKCGLGLTLHGIPKCHAKHFSSNGSAQNHIIPPGAQLNNQNITIMHEPEIADTEWMALFSGYNVDNIEKEIIYVPNGTALVPKNHPVVHLMKTATTDPNQMDQFNNQVDGYHKVDQEATRRILEAVKSGFQDTVPLTPLENIRLEISRPFAERQNWICSSEIHEGIKNRSEVAKQAALDQVNSLYCTFEIEYKIV